MVIKHIKILNVYRNFLDHLVKNDETYGHVYKYVTQAFEKKLLNTYLKNVIQAIGKCYMFKKCWPCIKNVKIY